MCEIYIYIFKKNIKLKHFDTITLQPEEIFVHTRASPQTRKYTEKLPAHVFFLHRRYFLFVINICSAERESS